MAAVALRRSAFARQERALPCLHPSRLLSAHRSADHRSTDRRCPVGVVGAEPEPGFAETDDKHDDEHNAEAEEEHPKSEGLLRAIGRLVNDVHIGCYCSTDVVCC
jgi:hypothetical protein